MACAKSLHLQRNYRLGWRERGLRTDFGVHPFGVTRFPNKRREIRGMRSSQKSIFSMESNPRAHAI
jgi:hypothetical protein